jgi:hypothetical protein
VNATLSESGSVVALDAELEVMSYRAFCTRKTLEAWYERRRAYEHSARTAGNEQTTSKRPSPRDVQRPYC